MGTGKTTVGRMVAQKLGFTFVDSDHEIEHQTGKTVPEIFAGHGEAEFRRLERAFVADGHAATRMVVACGGGLVAQPGLLDQLQDRGVVICLHASLDTILQRTAHNANRPLLNVADRAARVRELYAEREPIYRKAGSVILTDGRSLGEVVSHVLRTYRREAGGRRRQPPPTP